jgi:hypothetical protein
VFGASKFYIPFMTIAGDYNATDQSNNKAEGLCQFQSVSEEWSGLLRLKFNMSDYKNSYYICDLQPVTSDVVFRFLANLQDADDLIAKIDFSYGLRLAYEQKYQVFASGFFLGLPAKLVGNFSYVPDALKINLGIPEFSTGFSNILAKNVTGQLHVDSSSSYSEIQGIYEVWGVSQNSTLFIEKNMFFSIQGLLFQGVYNITLMVNSNISYFYDAN